MSQKQDLLENTHKTLYYSLSPLKKYRAFVKFTYLNSNKRLSIASPITLILFFKFLFNELTYTIVYRIKSALL